MNGRTAPAHWTRGTRTLDARRPHAGRTAPAHWTHGARTLDAGRPQFGRKLDA